MEHGKYEQRQVGRPHAKSGPREPEKAHKADQNEGIHTAGKIVKGMAYTGRMSLPNTGT